MLRVAAVILGLGLLTGCGVDGEPWTPTMGVNIGVGTGGVHSSGHVGVSNGTVGITIGNSCWGCW